MARPIHRKKLFKGVRTAEEVHQQHAFPPHAKCSACGRPPATRGIVMMEMKEAMKNPAVQAMAGMAPQDFLKQTVQIKDSGGRPVPYFRAAVAYACKDCTPSMERQLAKAPSHCIVEINHAPKDRFVMGYAGGSAID